MTPGSTPTPTSARATAALRALPVFLDVPPQHQARALWVLDTLLAPCGARVVLERDPTRAPDCALVYAHHPLPDVPTLPASTRATELFAHDTPLAADAFTEIGTFAGPVTGAFPMPSEGFALDFDPIASAFVLLACWDEHTSAERDRYGRLPYAASVFAANAALRIEQPAVDAYLRLIHTLVDRRLSDLGQPPLDEPGWGGGGAEDGAGRGDGTGGAGASRFAVALTHDIDNLKRWTLRGFVATLYRSARAVRYRRWAALRLEMRDLRRWLFHHLPHGTDPYWTFSQMLGGEDERGASSTFFVIASHGHKNDGVQPETYAKRIPAALALLRAAAREIGLHGNDRDRTEEADLHSDRVDLAVRAGANIAGIRFHYLRCLYHDTLPMLDREGFGYDSSMAFAEHEGFRCGFSYPFHPYDLANERPLALLELPLVLMDTSLQGTKYRALDDAAALKASIDVLDGVRASGCAVALLWHNNRFDPVGSAGYDQTYWQLLDWIAERDGVALSAGELVRRWRERCGEAAAGAPAGASADAAATAQTDAPPSASGAAGASGAAS